MSTKSWKDHVEKYKNAPRENLLKHLEKEQDIAD